MTNKKQKSKCFHCGSNKTIKAGLTKLKQRYKCHDCGKHFFENQIRTFKKTKKKPEVEIITPIKRHKNSKNIPTFLQEDKKRKNSKTIEDVINKSKIEEQKKIDDQMNQKENFWDTLFSMIRK